MEGIREQAFNKHFVVLATTGQDKRSP